MKNTEKKYNITKNNIKKILITTQIAATTLFISLVLPTIKNSTNDSNNLKIEQEQDNEIINNENTKTNKNEMIAEKFTDYKGIYDNIYVKKYKETNDDNFDKKFSKIYHESLLKIGDKEYKIDDLDIRHTINGTTHFVINGYNHYDIFTQEEFYDDEDYFAAFRDSTIFYNMYKDGVINSTEITLTYDMLKPYKENWTPSNHTEIKRLYVEKITSQEYQEAIKKIKKW